jgi:host factor-I protein
MVQSSVQLQSVFLEYLCKNSVPTTLFLVNGVKLQGFVTAFDNFSVLLTRDDRSQLVYKHAISAAHPLPPIHLGPDQT